MELNNLLRPEKVKQQTKINKTRLADELFNAYQAEVLHQIYDKHENQALSIPIAYEGWLSGNWVYNTELSSLMDKMKSLDSDGVEKVAKKLFDLMEKLVGHLSSDMLKMGYTLLYRQAKDKTIDKKFIIQLSILFLIFVIGLAVSVTAPNFYESLIAGCETVVATILLVWWWTQS